MDHSWNNHLLGFDSLAILLFGFSLLILFSGCDGSDSQVLDNSQSTTSVTPGLSPETPAGLPNTSGNETIGNETVTSGNNGRWTGLTFKQAQELSPFPLYKPDPLPEGFVFKGASLYAPPSINGTTREPIRATLVFKTTTEPPILVQLTETSNGLAPPSPSQGEITELTIDSMQVTKITPPPPRVSGEPTMYRWEQDGVGFVLNAVVNEQLSEADIKQFIAAILNG